MDLQLTDRRVVVFGAVQGIGKAVVAAFRAEGARVFQVDLNPPEETDYAAVDISDAAAVKALVDQVGRNWGGIDHVICTAAVGSGKFGFPFWNLDAEDWRRVLDITLIGSVNVALAAQPWLCAGDFAEKTLLLFTSVAGQIGSQTDPPYSAAKAGIINFTQCAAKDFAPYGVRVNALSPGMVKTQLNESVWAAGQAKLPVSEQQSYPEWAGAKIASIAPLKRWQEVEEFAAMAVYLASPWARNITGQTINIDGGQVMHS
jgi:2-hydroxycyclohexanecarboxyl-CoA dehydrogenase